MARRKFHGIIAVSPTGTSFLVIKRAAKWYLLGQSVDKAMVLPMTMSTNKRRLLQYVKKELGFEIL